MMEQIKKRYIDFIVYIIFASMVVILYHPALNSYWLFDDLQILKHAIDHHPWEYFFIPKVWQELSVANLTPLVTLSFDLDLMLFGFDPKWFYLHHLISLWLVTVMIYIVLGLWISRSFSFFGALLFLTSAPPAAVSELLMLRHYSEGAILVFLSFYLFVIALRKESFRLTFLSALIYFFAMSAKEIYVPLIIVVLFLPEKNWLTRFKYSAPLLCAVFLYFLWRLWMLGLTVGGYRNTFMPEKLDSYFVGFVLRNILESVTMFSGSLSIHHIVHELVIFLFLILLTIAFSGLLYKRKFSVLIFFSILTFSIYLPIFPLFNAFSVKEFLSYRFIFFVSIFFAVIISYSCAYNFSVADRQIQNLAKSKIWQHGVINHIFLRLAKLFCCLVFLVYTFWNSYQWINLQRKTIIRPLVSEGHFLMNADSNYIMVKTIPFPANNYYENLDYFRLSYKKQRTPYVVYGIFAYMNDDQNIQSDKIHAYKYSIENDRMIETTEEFLRKRAEYLLRVRELPLQVKLTIENGVFHFSLGPSSTGRYFLLAGYHSGFYCASLDIDRDIRGRLYTGLKSYLRFGRESPEGWITLSPEWFVDFSKKQEIIWEQ